MTYQCATLTRWGFLKKGAQSIFELTFGYEGGYNTVFSEKFSLIPTKYKHTKLTNRFSLCQQQRDKEIKNRSNQTILEKNTFLQDSQELN